MKVYRVVYGDGIVYRDGIPTPHAANIVMKQAAQRPYMQANLLTMRKQEYNVPGKRRPNRFMGGRQVLNRDYYYADALCPGALVENEVISELIDALPPTYLSSSLFQSGGAYSMREIDGRCRPTYATFQRVDHDTWKYCGACFRGEKEERGEELPYV